MMDEQVTVVGAGLAGSECAWQLAESGVRVRLVEQKPAKRTPAQVSDHFAELVCSNSLRGADLTNAVGLLKEEMRRTGSLIMSCADVARVPAGGALAVDRDIFSRSVTERLRAHRNIRVVAAEVTAIPDGRPVVLATGPLTGDALAQDIEQRLGGKQLAYYDAISPVITADSIDWSKVFRASRYGKGEADAYVNCPLDKVQYEAFVAAVLAAEKVEPREFEKIRYFEGCLPIEVMAARGPRTLAFGPMKPVGLTDPRTGRWPYAVVQLRQEDGAGTAYNLVGFQTRMKYGEQKRVFSLIPGLENAEFERLGSVHRNTFVNAPAALNERYELRAAPGVHLVGQITGTEGYVEAAASGLVLGIALAHELTRGGWVEPPPDTALGALKGYLARPSENFQPSNVTWSMFPPLEGTEAPAKKLQKRARYAVLAQRALTSLEGWLAGLNSWRPVPEARYASVDAPAA